MSRSIRIAFTLALAPLALAACDPRAFDDLADQTWVDTQGKPGDLDSDDYGVALGFGGSGGTGLRVVAASRTPAGVARLVYDAGGGLEQQAELIGDTQQVNQLAERPAIAGDPSSFGMATGTVALGATDGSTAFALMIDVEAANLQLSPLNLTIAGEPSGLAFGAAEASGAGTGPDLVAVAGTALAIKPDYQTNSTVASCTLPAEATAVHLADLTGDGVAEVIVGFADGTMLPFGGSFLVANAGAGCDDGVPPPPFDSETASPIRAIASGDLDGDGATDLVLGFPDLAQVIIVSSTVGGTYTVDGAGELGAVLAVGDLDGDGNDDLALGDSSAAPDGTANAGSVYLFKGGATLEHVATLHDASPEAGQRFGQALTIGSFDDDRDVLVVGAKDEIFTYFRSPLGGDDVRR